MTARAGAVGNAERPLVLHRFVCEKSLVIVRFIFSGKIGPICLRRNAGAIWLSSITAKRGNNGENKLLDFRSGHFDSA